VQNPSHLYHHPGRYLVTLTVTGADGSIGTSAPYLVRVQPRWTR
jgi:PKD repeat protein